MGIVQVRAFKCERCGQIWTPRNIKGNSWYTVKHYGNSTSSGFQMWKMWTNLDTQKYKRWIWIDREVSTESVPKVQKPVLEHTEKKVENC